MYIGMDRCRLSVSFPGYEDEESVVVVRKSEGFPVMPPIHTSRMKWNGAQCPCLHPLSVAVVWAQSRGDMQVFLSHVCMVIRGSIRREYERSAKHALRRKSPLPLDIIHEIVTYLYD